MFERVLNTQKQPPEVFLKNSQSSHEKHMCQSLFIKKHEGLIKNETPTQVVSCEFCKIFKNTYFEENLRTATSAVNYFRKKFHFFMLDSVLNTPFQPATFFRILLILIITLHKICKTAGFHWPVFSRIRTKSTTLSIYGRIRVSESLYSRIFYAVSGIKTNM